MILTVALHGPDGTELGMAAGYRRARGGFRRDAQGQWVNSTDLEFGEATDGWPPVSFATLIDEDGEAVSFGPIACPLSVGPQITPRFPAGAISWAP